MTVEVRKFDVYKNGQVNNAVIRHAKFHFEDEDDARVFMAIVKKTTGYIEHYEVSDA